MSLSLHRFLVKESFVAFCLFVLLQLPFSFAHATGENIQVQCQSCPGGKQPSISLNPCAAAYLVVGYTPPGGYELQKVAWYVNGSLVTTVNGLPTVTLPVVSSTFAVYCVVTYVNVGNSSQTTTATAPTFNGVSVNKIFFNAPTGPNQVNFGCVSPLSYVMSIGSQGYTPTSNDIKSYNWTYPAGWAQTASGATSTVTPDQTDGGNVSVGLTLTCGYTSPSSPVLAVSRISPTTSWANGNPVTLCDNSTATLNIVPPCGPSSYTWTITGNSIAQFQSSGSQTLTTTTSSAVISTGLLSGATTNVAVKANYPGGSSSAAINTTLSSGAPVASSLSIVSQGPTVCPNVLVSFGARYNGSCGDFNAQGITNVKWNVAPTPLQIVNNAGTASCGVGTSSGMEAKFTSSPTMYNVTIYATNACGTSSASNAYIVTISSSCPQVAADSADSSRSNGAVLDESLLKAEAMTATSGISVAPNPSSGRVLLSLKPGLNADNKFPSVVKQVDVYNTLGARIKSFNYGAGVKYDLSLDLGNTGNGLYILVISTEKGKVIKKVSIIR